MSAKNLTTKDAERIEEALDALADIAKNGTADEDGNRDYDRKSAAEEILRHYREIEVLSNITITVHHTGAVPVRPMTRAELAEEKTHG